ncbi:hypothetical protein [Vreelandella populi]|uniref:hypothetical protein n=1 Tax=Vreelandella populi TaxID=2498858 RepID=UPI000F8E4296|nr:hypothetical protein [Halomonas populi]RUR51394.1 hypothetical protein ELY40_16470 [Halomonas populi]
MSTVIPIQSETVLAQAHRDAMAHIQDLAITITLQGVYAVNAEYSGHAHELNVSVLVTSEIEEGNFKSTQRMRVELPGKYSWCGHHALEKLQAAARTLEALLTPPKGDDAA